MYKEINEELFAFVGKSPTAGHTVKTTADMLEAEGFGELLETEPWNLDAGGKYYVKRSMTSIIAFRVPQCMPNKSFTAFSVVAPHGDSPCFKIKENPEMKADGRYTKLNTEVYGGMNLNLWYDRRLSAAGRVLVGTADGVQARLIDFKRDLFIIPSLAIHMNRDANNGVKINPQADTLPLYGSEKADFAALVAEEAHAKKEDIISYDLYLYNREEGTFFGENEEFIACPKLDDLQCTFSAVKAFLQAENGENVTVCAIFDNEEIGSMTKQGADSTFLNDVLERISLCADKTPQEHRMALAGSFMLSADNAHAVHPNCTEKSDPTNRCYLNGGVVVKNSPSYTTDAQSSGVFRRICENAGVPVQSYYKRSDEAGGSTLGNIANTHVSLHTVDIGLPQLAMHSPYETGGAKDTDYMIKAMAEFYASVISCRRGGTFIIGRSAAPVDNWQDISSR